MLTLCYKRVEGIWFRFYIDNWIIRQIINHTIFKLKLKELLRNFLIILTFFKTQLAFGKEQKRSCKQKINQLRLLIVTKVSSALKKNRLIISLFNFKSSIPVTSNFEFSKFEFTFLYFFLSSLLISLVPEIFFTM